MSAAILPFASSRRAPRVRSGSLEDALCRLQAVMNEQQSRTRHLDYALRSRAGMVALHGESPAEPAAAAILVELDARIAALTTPGSNAQRPCPPVVPGAPQAREGDPGATAQRTRP